MSSVIGNHPHQQGLLSAGEGASNLIHKFDDKLAVNAAMISDEALLRQLQTCSAGEFDVLFERLWKRHSDRAYYLARRIGSGKLRKEDCFDIAQDIGLKIFKWIKRKKITLDDKFVFKKFFNKCVRDETISALRKLNTIRKLISRTLGDRPDDTIAFPVLKSMYAAESTVEIDWLLEGAEPDVVIVFKLYHLMGLTLAEISKRPEVALSIGRVFRLLEQARGHLQRRYRDRGSV